MEEDISRKGGEEECNIRIYFYAVYFLHYRLMSSILYCNVAWKCW
jgi:hypothetical protein